MIRDGNDKDNLGLNKSVQLSASDFSLFYVRDVRWSMFNSEASKRRVCTAAYQIPAQSLALCGPALHTTPQPVLPALWKPPLSNKRPPVALCSVPSSARVISFWKSLSDKCKSCCIQCGSVFHTLLLGTFSWTASCWTLAGHDTHTGRSPEQ